MNAKQLSAEHAVQFVKDGMTVGLGTGSTSAFAIEAIGKKEIVLFSVAEPVTEAAETAAAEAAPGAGEVEMIKEKKDEEGGAAKPGEKAPDKAEAKAEAKPAEKKK